MVQVTSLNAGSSLAGMECVSIEIGEDWWSLIQVLLYFFKFFGLPLLYKLSLLQSDAISYLGQELALSLCTAVVPSPVWAQTVLEPSLSSLVHYPECHLSLCINGSI